MLHPAGMRAVLRSEATVSMPVMSARLTIRSSDAQSGMKLCPAPTARTFFASRTSAASSPSSRGRATDTGAVTLPDQLLQPMPVPLLPGAEAGGGKKVSQDRSEEHTSELQSLMRISYAVFCLTNKINIP